MPRFNRTTVAVGLAVVGVSAALAFRKNHPVEPAPAPVPPPIAVAHSTAAAPLASATLASHLEGRIEPLEAMEPSAPVGDPGWIQSRSTDSSWPPPLGGQYAVPETSAPLAPATSSTSATLSSLEHPAPDDVLAPRAPDTGSAWRYHTVTDGDTLSTLAARYLGNAGRFHEIHALNRQLLSDPDVLPIGARLRLPAESSATASDEESDRSDELAPLSPIPGGLRSAIASGETYRVQAGDTLATLAERFLGDANRAGELLAANSDRLRAGEAPSEGTLLVIP